MKSILHAVSHLVHTTTLSGSCFLKMGKARRRSDVSKATQLGRIGGRIQTQGFLTPRPELYLLYYLVASAICSVQREKGKGEKEKGKWEKRREQSRKGGREGKEVRGEEEGEKERRKGEKEEERRIREREKKRGEGGEPREEGKGREKRKRKQRR